MVRVNLEVESEKKEKWERHAKDHPESNGNLSAFIRSCVDREIEGNHSEGFGDSEEVLKKLGKLGDSINAVHERMDGMETRLSSLETETKTDTEIEELKGEVFDYLPDKEPGSVDWKAQRQELKQSLSTESDWSKSEYNAWKGTIEGLSIALDESKYRVEKAIERLQETTQLVRTTEHNDETRYYKVI